MVSTHAAPAIAAAVVLAATLPGCQSTPDPILFECVQPPSTITTSLLNDAIAERRTLIRVGLCGAEYASVLESEILARLTVNTAQDNALLTCLRAAVLLELAPEYERQRSEGAGAVERARGLFAQARSDCPEFVPATLGLARVARLEGSHAAAIDRLAEATDITLRLIDVAPVKGELDGQRGLLELLGVLKRIETPTGNTPRFERLAAWLRVHDSWTDLAEAAGDTEDAEARTVNTNRVFQRLYATILTELALVAAESNDHDTAREAFDLAYRADPDFLPGRLEWANWSLAIGEPLAVSREFEGWLSLAERESEIAWAADAALVAAAADADAFVQTRNPDHLARSLARSSQVLRKTNRNAQAWLLRAKALALDPEPDLVAIEEALRATSGLAGCVTADQIASVTTLLTATPGERPTP